MPVAGTNPHDALFRGLLESPSRAAALIRDHLPPEIAAALSTDPPRPVDGSFIDDALKESRTDRLFAVTLTDGRPAYLYTLLEHKSAPQPDTPLQLAGYMLAIWKRHLKEAGASATRLPPIIPIVFYHGARPWTVPLSLGDCIEANDRLRPWVTGMRYVLRDLGPIAYEALSQERAVRAALGALKYAYGRATREVLERLLADLPDGDSLEVQILTYIVRVYDITIEDVAAAVARARPERRDELMPTVAEQWVWQGRAEGRIEGRIEGMADMLLRQLRRRFGALPEEIESRVRSAGVDALDAWSDRILDASSLDDVFDPDRAH